jgi:hypothetical protein
LAGFSTLLKHDGTCEQQNENPQAIKLSVDPEKLIVNIVLLEQEPLYYENLVQPRLDNGRRTARSQVRESRGADN